MKKIMRHSGIPTKIVEMIMDTHYNTFCQVAVDGTLTDSFEVKSGVLQGGILSPTIAIPSCLSPTVGDRHNGIDWVDNRKLCDLRVRRRCRINLSVRSGCSESHSFFSCRREKSGTEDQHPKNRNFKE